MALLWREQMSVGNAVIDMDHRHLIGLMNTVELALRTGKEPDLVRVALDQLDEYIAAHFAREERIQRAIGYPGADRHQAEHVELKARLSDIRAQIEARLEQGGAAGEMARLMELLRRWLLDHILTEDVRLKPLLRERPEGFAG